MKRILSSILILAMLLTMAPAVLAASVVTIGFGETEFTVKPGESVDVPVYISSNSADSIVVGLLQFDIGIPTGFTVKVTDGLLKFGSDVTATTSRIRMLKENPITCTAKDPLCTITFTAPETEGTYTVELSGDENFLIDEGGSDLLDFDVAKANITVKNSTTPTVTLDSIKVEPSELTVPYANQTDIEGYVKSNVKVVAIYSDSSEKDITDYAIAIDGTTATITYEGKTTNVALKLEPAPTSDKIALKVGNGTYTVKGGETFDVPVYVVPAKGDSIVVGLLQLDIGIPTGFTAKVTDGLLKFGSDVTATTARVRMLKENPITCTAIDPLCTITFTAPEADGTYTIELSGDENFLIDEGGSDLLDFDIVKSTVTVTGGSTPTKVLDSITVSSSPTTVTIPYGADAEETIRKAITVKALYTNGDTEDNVTGYELEIGDTTATVKYTVDGVTKTADIALIREAVPVLTVENTKVTVPYGTTADAAFITKAIGEVKLNDTTLTADKYTVTYNSGDATATVKYNDDDKVAAVTIDVNYVVLTTVEVALKPGVEKVELPWDIEAGKEIEFIKSCIVVTVKFSDNTTKELAAADYEVMYIADKGEFYVEFNGQQSTTMTVTKGVQPAAELTEITVNPTEVVVPYGTEDAKLGDVIRAAVVVTAKYDDSSEAAVSEYSISVADGKATITYEDKTAEVTLVYETRELVLDKTDITLEEGVTKDDVINEVKNRVAVKFVYSKTTPEKVLNADEYEVTVNDEMTVITVTADGETQTINLKIMSKPDFISEDKADNAYGITGTKLVIFTNVKDGKVLKINDEKGSYDATYMGNGKWAAVVTGTYSVVPTDGTLPEAAKFGRLHDTERVTAYDALLTLLKANNNAVNTFDDNYQMYLLADVDGNGEITADEALYINKISLGLANDADLWFNK